MGPPAESGLDLVSDEEDVVLLAQGFDLGHVPVLRHHHARLALAQRERRGRSG
jgi:hypothetical protein